MVLNTYQFQTLVLFKQDLNLLQYIIMTIVSLNEMIKELIP